MKIGLDKFLFIYQQEQFKDLSAPQEKGLVDLLLCIEADEYMNNKNWIAYVLATTLHECAGTWQPIAEYGKGKGKKYGEPDPITGKTYYGRGFVQLTWKMNYKTMSGYVGADLVNEPDLAMEPDIAYDIMSVGMRKGLFTGVGLSKYINDTKCDYMNARRIINGTDCANKIANYAIKFEHILREC